MKHWEKGSLCCWGPLWEFALQFEQKSFEVQKQSIVRADREQARAMKMGGHCVS